MGCQTLLQINQMPASLYLSNIWSNVDATYLFSLMSHEYSPACSSRRELEETLMDNFHDFLVALDDGNITG